MNLLNIDDFDLRHNTHEIILKMIEAAKVPYDEIIIFGGSFGQVVVSESDDITWNKNTIVIEHGCGNTFVVNHMDIAAFKVIR